MIPSTAALGTHLWQSTAFAVACFVVTLLLRRNKASVRYAVWLAASLKFLFPLSLLIGVGARVGEYTNVRVVPDQWVSSATAAQPVKPVEPAFFQAGPAPSRRAAEPRVGTRFLVYGWLSGVAIVALWGFARRQRFAARIGKATCLSAGREVDALHRVQLRYGLARPVRLASSTSSVEPGVRGIIRPVLFLPAGIPDRLNNDELETIIAHELCHIRRWDNLAAVFHVIVQTVFWFHPLVWWIGSRLVDERERACDENVLRLGSDPHTYASAILRVCEFYVAAPSSVVSRVTGSNLKTRIEDIMMQRTVIAMSFGRKLSLACAAAVFIAAPVLFGMTTAPGAKVQAAAPRVLSPPTVAVSPKPAAQPPAATPTAQTRPPVQPRVETSPNPPIVHVVSPPALEASPSDYLIHAGDELEIVVWKQPDLTRRILVRPDGRIGIPLIGDVEAEGLTPRDLQQAVQERLRKSVMVMDPLVTVIVAAARKPQVTIQGSIARPGVYVLEQRLTVLDLVAQAGGLLPFAKREQISVFREQGGRVQPYFFNYTRYVAGLELDRNIVLKEGDIVIVP